MTMVPAASDSDGTHPLERIAVALEKIVYRLENPPLMVLSEIKDIRPGEINWSEIR